MGHLDFILTHFKHGCSALGRRATRAAWPSEMAFPPAQSPEVPSLGEGLMRERNCLMEGKSLRLGKMSRPELNFLFLNNLCVSLVSACMN